MGAAQAHPGCVKRSLPGVQDDSLRGGFNESETFEQSWNWHGDQLGGCRGDGIMAFDVFECTQLKLRVLGESWSTPKLLGEAQFKVDEDVRPCRAASCPARMG